MSSMCKGESWVTSWGAQLGDRGGGGGSVMVILLEFFLCREFFFSRREAGEEGKISSDLKKCNETWSL